MVAAFAVTVMQMKQIILLPGDQNGYIRTECRTERWFGSIKILNRKLMIRAEQTPSGVGAFEVVLAILFG